MARSTTASISEVERTSQRIPIAVTPCAFAISAATCSHRSALRPQTTTFAPASASASAKTRPRPAPPPVTIAARPLRSKRSERFSRPPRT